MEKYKSFYHLWNPVMIALQKYNVNLGIKVLNDTIHKNILFLEFRTIEEEIGFNNFNQCTILHCFLWCYVEFSNTVLLSPNVSSSWTKFQNAPQLRLKLQSNRCRVDHLNFKRYRKIVNTAWSRDEVGPRLSHTFFFLMQNDRIYFKWMMFLFQESLSF